MRYKIRHTTSYQYNAPVSLCHNRLCLAPIDTSVQKCLSSSIQIHPAPDEISERTDFFGNKILFFSIYKEHSALEVVSESEVQTPRIPLQQQAMESGLLWQQVNGQIHHTAELYEEIVQYLLPSNYIPRSETIRNYAQNCFPAGATLWDCCHSLMRRIYKDIIFTPGFTTINTPVETVLKTGKGVCQDIAHLMISCLRNMNIPARYVSGYIETLPPPGQEKLAGSDASHAWVSVYFPVAGWVDFDPTNCQLTSDQHVVVAYGRDYQDVAPTKGIVFSAGEQRLHVEVDVMRM